MIYLKNKLLLLICCVLLLPFENGASGWLMATLIALVLSALIGYFERPELTRSLMAVYLLLCIISPGFLYLLPFVVYDLMEDRYQMTALLFLVPLLWHGETLGIRTACLLVLFALIGALIRYYSGLLDRTKNAYLDYQDEARESEKILEEKNQRLAEQQEYEVKLATLDERNRIAREIHDHVGHMISSALIQIGALMAVEKDPQAKERLGQVKETLSTGMDSIRSSIHNLHEDSVDLQMRVQNLLDEFTFCETELDYNLVAEMSVRAKYTIIFIVKEALANVMKHSDATKVSVALLEQPAFFQVIIQDNGTRKKKSSGSGMGTSSMRERIEQLQGNLTIREKGGYRLFIVIPKGGNLYESIDS